MQLAVRSHIDPAMLVEPIRGILKSRDPNIPLADPSTMEAIIDDALSDFRVVTSSLGLLSVISVLLALVGLYGVLAHYVGQRHREIGVRMTLGASALQVAKMVLSRGLALVAAGVAAGSLASFWTTRVIRRLLFGIDSTDPITFVSTALGFALVAAIACLVPAYRASRVDPVLTLKAE
jgi:ABC-type antimicrobial peptide transport system permease subunit